MDEGGVVESAEKPSWRSIFNTRYLWLKCDFAPNPEALVNLSTGLAS